MFYSRCVEYLRPLPSISPKYPRTERELSNRGVLHLGPDLNRYTSVVLIFTYSTLFGFCRRFRSRHCFCCRLATIIRMTADLCAWSGSREHASEWSTAAIQASLGFTLDDNGAWHLPTRAPVSSTVQSALQDFFWTSTWPIRRRTPPRLPHQPYG